MNIERVKKKDRYGDYTGKTEKQKIKLDDVSFKMYITQIRDLEKSLKSARKKVRERRKKYEQQLKGHIWIQATGLIEDVEKELTDLTKIDESLISLRSTIEEWPKEEDVTDEEDEEVEDDW